MHLQFENEQAAVERNRFEAFKRGCVPPSLYWWSNAEEHSGKWYIDVTDGDGLTEDELNKCFIITKGEDGQIEPVIIAPTVTSVSTVNGRELLTEDLVAAATAFGLGDFIQIFFFTHRKVIQKYILNGGDELYNLYLTAPEDLEKLDRTNAEGISPRMYALALLDFYKTNTNGNK
ncbi:MAG: hypothetical protein ACPGD8_06255 [Flavobacteriales bacterium]